MGILFRPFPVDSEALLRHKHSDDDNDAVTAVIPSSLSPSSRILSRIITLGGRIRLFVVPTFLRGNADHHDPRTIEKLAGLMEITPNTTAYLDGVRGIASLIVFFFHWLHIR